MSAISLEQARTIIAAALAKGAEAGFQPLSVVVLDAGGHLKAFERQDGASIMRFQVAHGKAFGAIGLGIGSRALMARAEQQPYFIASVNGAFGGALVPVPGGVLVKTSDGELIGAIGVSGDNSDNDEIAAVAGIEAAGFVPVTG
ncbi:MAG: hypothetical protein JWL70_1103 [Acidimicrobiia bacterium]|nr:hypothetical protein [Acidimicrobiia bacterium]